MTLATGGQILPRLSAKLAETQKHTQKFCLQYSVFERVDIINICGFVSFCFGPGNHLAQILCIFQHKRLRYPATGDTNVMCFLSRKYSSFFSPMVLRKRTSSLSTWWRKNQNLIQNKLSNIDLVLIESTGPVDLLNCKQRPIFTSIVRQYKVANDLIKRLSHSESKQKW